MCAAANRLDGRVVVVTGGNTGIGKETVRELVKRGAKVITGCRDVEKAKRAVQEIKEETGHDVTIEPLDLSDIESVKKFAEKCLMESRLDILVNNAGLMMPVRGLKTKQDFEIHMGVNYLGHYLLTSLLYPLMVKTGTEFRPSRIVNVSSEGHKFTMRTGQDIDAPDFGLSTWGAGYTSMFAFHQLYGQSKLAQIYHAKEISRLAKEKGEHVIAVSLHPGAVATEITRYHNEGFFVAVTSLIENGLLYFGKTPLEGAQTTLHCCLNDSTYLEPGGYYVDCAKQELPSWYNDRQQGKLREVSDRLLGIQSSEPLVWTKSISNK
eukprot:TRINITY_DN14352_c0_g1_i1.p1 TRINITY_DN14352_c0_g1~~TRINITY_DN14352_c0_g1_i1.p1  ORF type:complete len:370 (-),score=90.95 TRINITY_DN14352_c0_g1_i1:35-1000(-)